MQRLLEPREHDRLDDVVERAAADRVLERRDLLGGRHQDDVDLSPLGAEPTQQVQPAALGEVEIQQDQVGLEDGGLLGGVFERAGHADDGEAVHLFGEATVQVGDAGVVLDDQDAQWSHPLSLLVLGMITVRIAPPSEPRSTVIAPPSSRRFSATR